MTRRSLHPGSRRHPAHRNHSPLKIEILEDRRLLAILTVTGTGDSVGGFRPGVTFGLEQVSDVAAGDFDGDGAADLVFGLDEIPGEPSIAGGVSIVLSN